MPEHMSTALPETVLNLLDRKNKTVVFAQRSDLTIDLSYGTSYLVLTESSLIVISDNTIVKNTPLSAIHGVRIEELTGGGRVVADTDSGVSHLVYYSNHMVPWFSDAIQIINRYINHGTITDYNQKYHVYCYKCNAPLPERGTTCPRCIPKLAILRRIISLTSPYRLQVFALMIVTALGIVFQMLPPYITKKIVDEVITGGNHDRFLLYIGCMMLVTLLYFIVRLVNIRLTTWISARVVTDLRSKLHAVALFLKLNFYTRREPGELVGRIMYDTGELQQFLVDGLPFLIVNCISFVVIGGILLSISWKLTLLVLIPLPFLIAGTSLFWKKINPLFLKEGTIIGHLYSVLSESLQGLRVTKSSAREQHRICLFDTLNQKLAQTQIIASRKSSYFNEVMFFIMSIGVAFVWYFATTMIHGEDTSFTLGDLMAFVSYIWLFFGPLQWFSVICNWMTHALSGAERIFEVLDTTPETYNDPHAKSIVNVQGAIEFRNVYFSYERGKEIIKGISFSIQPGEMIGLIGQSGAGKSTIINLLSRFYEPDSGEILLDGVSLNKLKLHELRKCMGIILQESFLYNATIAENIAYGIENVSFGEIIDAARAAYAHDFIIKKPDGYDTLVGDGGEKLSGGEKQRISIARTILHNPPILIMDEATSSVDTLTEQHIQKAISGLIRGRTTIAIAHRLSTLRNADRLIVLADGMIAETGTHDELFNMDGLYASMVRSHTHNHALKSVAVEG